MFGTKSTINFSNAQDMSALTLAAIRDGRFLDLTQSTIVDPNLQRAPLAPALRCVTALSIAFFGLYVALICVRALRLCSAWARARCYDVEAAIARASASLDSAPIFCVLALSARIRAVQLDPVKGDIEPWMPFCMYTSTAALLMRVVASLALDGDAGLAARAMLGLVLYACSLALACGVLAMHPADAGEAFPQLPMSRCLIALTVLVLLANLGLEAAEVGQRALGKASKALRPRLATMPTVAMFCVLLLAMTLRSVQLHVAPAPWASSAIYATTTVLMLQALASAGDASADALGLPGGGDAIAADAPPVAQRCCQWALAACACVGVAAVVVGVQFMEPEAGDGGEAPELSVAMWCVARLTLVYFSACIVLVLVRAAGASRRGALATRQAAPGLAFSPMICAMMVAVRLRAVMLHRRDPPHWAQVAMYCATFALTTQALSSILLAAFVVDEEDDDDERSVPAKMASIILLVMQYIAAAFLYASLVILIFALFVMSAQG